MKLTKKEQLILEKARILTKLIEVQKKKRIIDMLLRKTSSEGF